MSKKLQSVCVRRLLKSKCETVFDAFSTTEVLSQWFSPSPEISVNFEVFEFCPQGQFRLLYGMPDGTQPVVNGQFQTIERPQHISFTWNWEAPDLHAGIPTLVIIRLVEKNGNTEIYLTHDTLPQDACERHAAGWEGTLDRLASLPDHSIRVQSNTGMIS